MVDDHDKAIPETGIQQLQRIVRNLVVLSSILLPAATYSSEEERARPAEFVVWSDAAEFKPPQVVVPFDPATRTGIDWDLAVGRPRYDASDAARLGDAVGFLREGIDRMAGGWAAETCVWLLRLDRPRS